MKKTRRSMSDHFTRAKAYLSNVAITEFLVVAILLLIVCVFLTGDVYLNINSKLYTGGIGDATSGFLWFAFADKGSGYLDGMTNLINYPIGETFWSPIYITWTFAMFPLWLISHIVSPIAALNLVMLFGFVSCGLVAYYLLKRITHDRYLSFVGAYAIAFVPYHLFKAPEHLTNILIWPLIGFIGLCIAFWRRQTIRRGIGLALVTAAALYTDGYYVFILFVLGLSLVVSLIAIDLILKRDFREILRKIWRLSAVVAGVMILVLPVAITQLTASKEINQDLSNSRDDIQKEVLYYSSKPIDFILPPEKNVTVSSFDWFEKLNAEKNTRSNSGENTNYVGVLVGVTYAAGCVTLAAKTIQLVRRKELSKRKSVSLYTYAWVVSTLCVPLILLWMLPPSIHLFGHDIVTPIGILVDHISYWRVPARLFLVLHVFMVISAMLTLGYLMRRLEKKWFIAVLALCLAVIAVDYYTGIKRPAFGLGNMPKAYSWIHDQKDIKAVAELPLVDWPIEIPGYYVFAQLIHQKPILNSALARDGYGLFNPLSSVDNDETIRFIRERGIDTIVLHTSSCKPYDWGTLRYQEKDTLPPPYTGNDTKTVCVYKLNPATNDDPLFMKMHDGFSKSNYLSRDNKYWVVMNGGMANMSIVDDTGKAVNDASASVTFELSTVGDFKAIPLKWSASQDGKEVGSGLAQDGNSVQTINEVSSNKPIVVSVYDAANGKPTVQNQVGFSNIIVTKK